MTMKLAALLVLLLAAPAAAQTVEIEIDLAPLGYSAHTLHPAEADGNPATEEWLAVPRWFGGLYQVLAVAPDGHTCTGDWFAPADGLAGASVTKERRGDRDVLIVREAALFLPRTQIERVVGLTRPPC